MKAYWQNMVCLALGGTLMSTGGAVIGVQLQASSWAVLAFGIGILLVAVAPLFTLRGRIQELEQRLVELHTEVGAS